jgi:hypothetical protein
MEILDRLASSWVLRKYGTCLGGLILVVALILFETCCFSIAGEVLEGFIGQVHFSAERFLPY